ncbi:MULTISPECIES: hypothetical protein [unclassified Paenibacillus]|uniref:hypothetical protein n=1 Tax=unclassified Paenibacillus TaxID=185978 RepID=UPI001F2F0655|nr:MULTISPECIES: hypothetical protein [unclassified Paenibacillus]MDR9857843.1 hypothetical protein [Paenibacillus sp. VCA1]
MSTIPADLMKDRYWRGTLHLFLNQPRLKSVCTTKYIDVNNRIIKVDALKRQAQPWSHSEKFMLQLALHLFNERHKVNLSDMDFLDSNNKRLAFQAMQMRFGEV